MAILEWIEISSETTAAKIPPAPNGSNPYAGQLEYWTTTTRRAVWPDDGSLYAGRSYDLRSLYRSSTPDYRGQLVTLSQYPTPAAEVQS